MKFREWLKGMGELNDFPNMDDIEKETYIIMYKEQYDDTGSILDLMLDIKHGVNKKKPNKPRVRASDGSNFKNGINFHLLDIENNSTTEYFSVNVCAQELARIIGRKFTCTRYYLHKAVKSGCVIFDRFKVIL